MPEPLTNEEIAELHEFGVWAWIGSGLRDRMLATIDALVEERDRYRWALMIIDVAPDTEPSNRYAAISHKALFSAGGNDV